MSANPVANGGTLLRDLRPARLARPRRRGRPTRGRTSHEATRVLGGWLREVTRGNPDNFLTFAPDELASNRLQDILDVDRALLGGRDRARATTGSRPRGGSSRCSQRAHLPGAAGGLPADRAARRVHLLRGVHPHRRLDVQPAREVARGQRRSRRGGDPVAEPQLPAVVARLAPGPQRVHPPGPRLPRRGAEQEAVDRAGLPAAGRQHAAVDLRPLPALAALRQRRRGRQAAAARLAVRRGGRAALRPRRRDLGVGRHRTMPGEEPDVVLACAGDVPTLETLAAARHPARALPGPAGARRQRRRPDAAAAGVRAPARPARPRVRRPLHRRPTGRSSPSTATRG